MPGNARSRRSRRHPVKTLANRGILFPDFEVFLNFVRTGWRMLRYPLRQDSCRLYMKHPGGGTGREAAQQQGSSRVDAIQPPDYLIDLG